MLLRHMKPLLILAFPQSGSSPITFLNQSSIPFSQSVEMFWHQEDLRLDGVIIRDVGAGEEHALVYGHPIGIQIVFGGIGIG
jgi:hypothetical protein